MYLHSVIMSPYKTVCIVGGSVCNFWDGFIWPFHRLADAWLMHVIQIYHNFASMVSASVFNVLLDHSHIKLLLPPLFNSCYFTSKAVWLALQATAKAFLTAWEFNIKKRYRLNERTALRHTKCSGHNQKGWCGFVWLGLKQMYHLHFCCIFWHKGCFTSFRCCIKLHLLLLWWPQSLLNLTRGWNIKDCCIMIKY